MFFLLIINELNEIHNIRTKFLNLVLLNICRFEAILCRNVYKVRVYFDSLSLNKIYLDELFFFMSTVVEITSIWASDILGVTSNGRRL